MLDSFTIDHTRMNAPSLRISKTILTPHGDTIAVFDLRFCIPNKEVMPEKGLHTMEHLFAKFMRNYLNNKNTEIIDISPMGCRTGFYMSLVGKPEETKIIKAWKSAMLDILKIESQNCIKEINAYQCGNFLMHSLEEAKKIASKIIMKDICLSDNKKLKLLNNL